MVSVKKTIKKIFSNKETKIIAEKIPVYKGELLKGRKALVTGGSSGIGFAIAKAFCDNGAEVTIVGRNKDKLLYAREQLGENASIMAMDLSNVDDINNGFSRLIEDGKEIDILVNNAGVNSFMRFSDITEEEFDRVINTNLKGSFFLTQSVAKYMKTNNIRGNILNIGSSSSFNPAIKPYALSKWGIRGFTLGLAKSLLPYGIVVNGIAPGPTATGMLVKDDVGSEEIIANNRYPMGRYILPEEIANLAVFMVSSMGRMIVGDMVCMTGGCGVITYDYLRYGI